MKTVLLIQVAMVTVILSAPVVAQDDESQIILPLEAQTCKLPSAPARIPDEPEYDDLVKAKGGVTRFQEELATYRECLDSSREGVDLTDGNDMALTEAFNYTVEMEERVAEQFNVAVRAYKASQAEQTE